MDKVIKDVFGLAGVVAKATFNSKAVQDVALLTGLELEIEHAQDLDCGDYFNDTEDGSLRNNGREFVSVPMNYGTTEEALKQFFSINEIHPDAYSERTSVHVHVNAQDMTFKQVASVLAIYQVFERMLFTFIGDERDKNIFCVPLSETVLTHNACNRLTSGQRAHDVVYEWSKYTAFNLMPLAKFGTIEFRHMAGTADVQRILQWLRIINCIFHYAKTNDYATIREMLFNLNSNSQYDSALSKVFGNEADVLRCPDQVQFIEDGVLNYKFSICKDIPEVDHAAAVRRMQQVQLDAARRLMVNPVEWGLVPPAADPRAADIAFGGRRAVNVINNPAQEVQF